MSDGMHMRRSIAALAVLILFLGAAVAGCLSFDDYDGDGIYDSDDPDDDNDGIPDKWEEEHGLGSKNNTDAELDGDGDSLTNLQEYLNGTDPAVDDTDGDGIPDGWEVEYGLDATNATNSGMDGDGDGLSALEEFGNSTDPTDADTDGDGIWDGFEVSSGLAPLDPTDAPRDDDLDGLNNTLEFQAGTDPHDADTDGDLMPDGWEVDWGTNPLVDDAGGDPDGDGWDADHDLELGPDEMFTNIQEYENGTDPFDDDTDSDGMGDGFEALFGLEPLDDGDATDDEDEDGLSNLKEHMAGTSPIDGDTDGDGMDDLFEREWGLNPLSPVDAKGDIDEDDFSNLQEYQAGTNITDPDTDGDGVMDGRDVVPLADIAIRLSVSSVSFDDMVEGAIDNPNVGKAYEIYLVIRTAGIEGWTEVEVTLETTLDVDLFVVIDIPDNLFNVSISIELWENDTAESSGLNTDDHLDVDGTSEDLDCDIVYDLVEATWKGDTSTSVTDGHDDGLPSDNDHPDGAVTFSIEVVPA